MSLQNFANDYTDLNQSSKGGERQCGFLIYLLERLPTQPSFYGLSVRRFYGVLNKGGTFYAYRRFASCDLAGIDGLL